MSEFHFAQPGPMYWDFKCLVCGGDTKGHFWRLIKGENK